MLDLIDGETLLLDATEGGLGTIFGSLPLGAGGGLVA